MIFQQIRNATTIIQYAGKKFVTDPWLSKKDADGWIGPTVDLPLSIDDIIRNVDAFLVTHIHPDHFNVYGMPKDRPMYVQNQMDKQILEDLGFATTCVLKETGSKLDNVELYKTSGVHLDSNPEIMGEVCGIVLKHPSEKTIYIAGDTIWCPDVEEALSFHQPDIIVVNACAARLPEGRLLMDADDVYRVCVAAPKATVIVSHMEAVSHATVSRKDMKAYAQCKGICSNILIPDDGEAYKL